MSGDRAFCILLASAVVANASPPPVPATPDGPEAMPAERLTKEHVHKVTGSIEADWDEYGRLLRAGERVFPAYDAILADPASSPPAVARVFEAALRTMPAGRRYVPAARERQTHKEYLVRASVIQYLYFLGDPEDTPAIAAALSDESPEVVAMAARGLAEGLAARPAGLRALDVWLATAAGRSDERLRRTVTSNRDALKARLDKAATGKAATGKPAAK